MISPSDIFHGEILIVDNQAANVQMLEQMLRNAGYVAVTSTMDPAEVGGLHRRNRYDLILLDLQMPGLDGFQVMAQLKAIEAGGDLPVLAVSAQPDHKARALQAGARDFVSKPFVQDELLLRVRNNLEVRLLRAAARSGGIPAPPGRDVVLRSIAWVVATLAGLWLLHRLWKVVLLVVVALVLVGTFSPILDLLEARGLKRRNALLLVVLTLLIGAPLLFFLTVPSLFNQLTTMVSDLPGQRDRLIDLLGQQPFTAPLGRALSNVGLEQTFDRLQTFLVGYWSDAVIVVGYGVTALSLSFYLLADGKRTQGALYAVVPRSFHMRLARIVHNLEVIVGGYMRGQLLTSVALAVFTLLLLVVCGVRSALALALFAGLMDVIPFVGGLLATVPVVLTALSRGTNTAIVVLVSMWVYQQFENKVLVPKIYGHTLRLSPAVVILALVAGGTLLGVLGALLALPIAAGLQMILEELGVAMPGDDSDDSSARARDQKTEAAYELMSAGSTAPDAGQIANELAHGLRDANAWVEAKKKKSLPGAGENRPSIPHD